jgi:cell wall-associated NlpC family hydrolase
LVACFADNTVAPPSRRIRLMNPQPYRSLVLSLLMAGCVSCLTAACASSSAVPRPFPGAPVVSAPHPSVPPPAAPAPVPEPSDGAPAASSASDHRLTDHRYDGRAVAEYALAFQGVPYRFGGADPGGFDCSGLVHYVFAQYGIDLPRIVEEQWQTGDTVKTKDIKPGDLLFFSTKGPGASHVAIALDGDRFVHAPNSTGVVRVEALTSSYWGSHYLGARRVNRSSTSTN